MNSPKLKFRSLSWWLAGAYFVWCIFLFFAGPLKFYFAIITDPFMWPLLWSVRCVSYMDRQLDFTGDPRDVTASEEAHVYYLGSALLIITGTIWHWIIGRLASLLITAVGSRWHRRAKA
jgi:hypothetical protein